MANSGLRLPRGKQVKMVALPGSESPSARPIAACSSLLSKHYERRPVRLAVRQLQLSLSVRQRFIRLSSPPRWSSSKTRQITSYKLRTDHELATVCRKTRGAAGRTALGLTLLSRINRPSATGGGVVMKCKPEFVE